MTAHYSTSHPMEFGEPFTIVGSAEEIRELLCGPQDHNEHCKGWRWHMYVADDKKRQDAVMDEVRKMGEERRAYAALQASQRQADRDLAAWQALRGLAPEERVRQLWEAI